MGYDTRYTGKLKITPEPTAKLIKQVSNVAWARTHPDCPESHCDFTIETDEQGDAYIVHDGSEKTSDDVAWIKFLIARLGHPDYSVDGTLEAKGEDGKRYDIIAEAGEVFVEDYVQVKQRRRR